MRSDILLPWKNEKGMSIIVLVRWNLPLLAVSHLSVTFCLFAIACRRLWPGGCNLLMHTLPSCWIWPTGWGCLFDCKLACPVLADGPIFLRHHPLILISKQINLLTLKKSKRKHLLLRRSLLFFVHISKKIYENSL